MQRLFGRSGNLFMAVAAGTLRIIQGGSAHQAVMRSGFFRGLGIAAMACLAADLAMISA
jgi:hypothetical protein